jgi:hypothetical protein
VRRPPPAAVFPLCVVFAIFPASAQIVDVGTINSIELGDRQQDVLDDKGLLLVELSLDQITITDALGIYDSSLGLLIPVGELSRLLDADLTVQIGEGRIVGTTGEARRSVLADARNGIVRVDGTTQLLVSGDMVVGANEIYVRVGLLEKLLPVRLTFKEEELRLGLKALEPLPIQSRLDRLNKLRNMQAGSETSNEVYRVRSPAKLFTLPSFDISVDTAAQRMKPKYPYRYDIRAGGDLLFSNFQGFLASDSMGRPTSARGLLERRDVEGKALGPLGLTRVSAGDTYTPSLPLGARSLSGRGISMSTAPLTQASVFGRIDLRGELPLGYDIELYVNDILRSGQAQPVQGRYEFRDVPLTRGINIIRIVAYGPRGERTEQVQVVNVGGGQLEKGQFTLDLGVAQQERTLFKFRNDDSTVITAPGVGDLRVAVNMAYGISETLTVTAGAARYSPSSQDGRWMGTAGVRTSIAGVATQVDVAHDEQGGTAAAVALAGELFGLSTVVRHSEYRHGFIDETLSRAGGTRPVRRASEVDLDWQLRFLDRSLPLSFRVARDEFANGEVNWNGLVRASTSLGGMFLSSGLDFNRTEPALGASLNTINGFLTASSFAWFQWQLRASVDYQVRPRARLGSLSVTADRTLSNDFGLRLGLGHSFQSEETSLQFSLNRRFKIADISLDSFYSRPTNDWRIGLQLAFSLVSNPLGGGYSFARPGAAGGGNMALQAFRDRNANARFDKGEDPVPGVVINGPLNDKLVTDDKGRVLVTGLGYGSVAQVRTSLDEVALDSVAGPPAVIEFTPRAGTVAVVSYPLETQGEVMLKVSVVRGDKKLGLSAVMVQAIGANGEIREGITEYDGSILFDRLRAGSYRLALMEEQARRLKMRLAAPVTFTISADGGVAPDVEAVVVFDNAE